MTNKTQIKSIRNRATLIGAVIAALGIMLVALGMAPLPATADSSTGKYYSIANSKVRNTGKVLTASSSGSEVTMATYTGIARQHWLYEPANGLGMHVVNKSTGLCLHADFVGAPMTQKPCAETTKQLWLYRYPIGGHARLINAPTNNVLGDPAVTADFSTARLMPQFTFEHDSQIFRSDFRGQL